MDVVVRKGHDYYLLLLPSYLKLSCAQFSRVRKGLPLEKTRQTPTSSVLRENKTKLMQKRTRQDKKN